MSKNNAKTVEEYKELFINNKFGRLTVISHEGKFNGVQRWFCVCDCGAKVSRKTESLRRRPNACSCGCLRKDTAKVGSTKHGLHLSPEYQAYSNMKGRCLNPRNREYFRYGGRGISICQRWLESFQNFIDDMGMKSAPELSLDRIDSNSDYTPENCRWASAHTQSNNTRRNRFVIVNGVSSTMAIHCQRYGLNKNSVLYRVRKGLSYEEAFQELIKDKTG